MRPSSVVIQSRGLVFRCVGRGEAQWIRWRRRTTGEQQSGVEESARYQILTFLGLSDDEVCMTHTCINNKCAGSTDAKTADYHIAVAVMNV